MKETIIDVLDAEGKSLKIQSSWAEDECEFIVIHDSKFFSGRLTKEYAQELAQMLSLDFPEYIKIVRSMFTESGVENKFSFRTTEGDSWDLVWSKKSLVDDENVDVVYGSIKCKRLSPKEIESLLVDCIEVKKTISEELIELKKKEEDLESQVERMSKTFEEFLLHKDDREQVILTKFILLLNEKKKYIRKLRGTEDSGLDNPENADAAGKSNLVFSEDDMELD